MKGESFERAMKLLKDYNIAVKSRQAGADELSVEIEQILRAPYQNFIALESSHLLEQQVMIVRDVQRSAAGMSQAFNEACYDRN
jgi:hypothetical protein